MTGLSNKNEWYWVSDVVMKAGNKVRVSAFLVTCVCEHVSSQLSGI